MVSEQVIYAFSWASWSGIFAGVAAALAISILMAVFGVALGMGVIKPKDDNPMEHVGVAFGGWSFASVLVSMAVGGFVAGLFSGQRGIEHGFLVWAVFTIMGTFLSSLAVGSAFKAVGSAIKTVGSGAADVVSTVGKGAANTVSSVVGELRENVDLRANADKLDSNIRGILRDTEVDTLQPQYLEEQMQKARADLRTTLNQLALKPARYESTIGDYLQKQKGRLEALTKNIDQDAAVNVLMKKRGISREDAETMVSNAVEAYENVLSKAKETLVEAKDQVEEVKAQLKEMADDAREKADAFSNKAAKAALMAGIALIIAAAISMGAGACGAANANSWRAVSSSYTVR